MIGRRTHGIDVKTSEQSEQTLHDIHFSQRVRDSLKDEDTVYDSQFAAQKLPAIRRFSKVAMVGLPLAAVLTLGLWLKWPSPVDGQRLQALMHSGDMTAVRGYLEGCDDEQVPALIGTVEQCAEYKVALAEGDLQKLDQLESDLRSAVKTLSHPTPFRSWLDEQRPAFTQLVAEHDHLIRLHSKSLEWGQRYTLLGSIAPSSPFRQQAEQLVQDWKKKEVRSFVRQIEGAMLLSQPDRALNICQDALQIFANDDRLRQVEQDIIRDREAHALLTKMEALADQFHLAEALALCDKRRQGSRFEALLSAKSREYQALLKHPQDVEAARGAFLRGDGFEALSRLSVVDPQEESSVVQSWRQAIRQVIQAEEVAASAWRAGETMAAREGYTKVLSLGLPADNEYTVRAQNRLATINRSLELEAKDHYKQGLAAEQGGDVRKARRHFVKAESLGHPLGQERIKQMEAKGVALFEEAYIAQEWDLSLARKRMLQALPWLGENHHLSAEVKTLLKY